jgi:hypothetical protein
MSAAAFLTSAFASRCASSCALRAKLGLIEIHAIANEVPLGLCQVLLSFGHGPCPILKRPLPEG